MAVIYKILNVVTDDVYFGSARNPKKRRWEHWNDLKKGTHHCTALQTAWNEYGSDAFEFEILENVEDESQLLRIEDTYLIQHAGQPHCYNTALSSMQPPSNTPETIEKIRATMLNKWAEHPASHPRLGRKHSEETKAKISLNRKGKMVGDQHYRYGKTLSEEVRKKIGDTQRGVPKGERVLTEEGRAKIKEAAALGRYSSFKGKKHTKETKLRMSKRVICITDNLEFPSLTEVLTHYGIQMPTLRRALKGQKPITKGKLTGYWFAYMGVEIS
jgi:group I intron endonuclease